ncbi:MAG: tRNA delta(2)-isopentenylpyrophosphate transferase [Ferruginibacter sp.]|nr:tRNA delta(2)-isopentenylpyrophosphate transferase [Ferruginibacter sp.]
MEKTCFIIVGPTAVGKTAAAITIAEQLQTEIISADSRQCYRELNIGVARPSTDELAAVPHHFIASHSVTQLLTAADFETYALQQATQIFQYHESVVMVGGTGLYIKAFAEGLDPIPAVADELRNQIREQYAKNGMPWLQAEIREKDPLFFKEGEMQNPQRMMRALEVIQTTGESILALQSGSKQERNFRIVKLGLELPRELLYQRINQRVDQMMDAGLLEEARALIPQQQLNALQTVGYRELFAHFNGEISLARAIELIKQNSRHYAKRQLTWFKKDSEISWLDARDEAGLTDWVSRTMSRNTD